MRWSRTGVERSDLLLDLPVRDRLSVGGKVSLELDLSILRYSIHGYLSFRRSVGTEWRKRQTTPRAESIFL